MLPDVTPRESQPSDLPHTIYTNPHPARKPFATSAAAVLLGAWILSGPIFDTDSAWRAVAMGPCLILAILGFPGLGAYLLSLPHGQRSLEGVFTRTEVVWTRSSSGASGATGAYAYFSPKGVLAIPFEALDWMKGGWTYRVDYLAIAEPVARSLAADSVIVLRVVLLREAAPKATRSNNQTSGV